MEKAVLTTLRKNLCQMSEKNWSKSSMDQKQKIEKVRIFKMFSEHVQNSLDDLSVKILPIVRNSFARSSEIKRKRKFSKKNFSSNCTPWTRRKQFWQVYGKFFCQKSEKISPEVRVCIKNIRKIEKICFVNWFSEQVEISFDKFSVKFFPNVRSRFNQKPKKRFFRKNSSNCLSQLLESGLEKFAKELPKIRNLFTNSPSILVYIGIKKSPLKSVSSNCFLNTQDSILTSFLWNFNPNSEMVSLKVRR